ncbi:MAG: hypothetical protein KME20_03515 [Kaiparowitsia implicata GSE-PSE-MK54-09C]|jgi:hypothetical protein|nr:hypothetical protein [Kaiparowitsia implicata GSE-PSE-MK54-09C]
MSDSVRSPQNDATPLTPAEIRLQKEQMQDVVLLMDAMFRREETTVKLIIENLYDVGAINLINQKLQSRTLQKMSKGAARLSKPLARAIAVRWVQKNCPQLIGDWLYSKVRFEPAETAADLATGSPDLMEKIPESQTNEAAVTDLEQSVSQDAIEEAVNAIIPELMEDVIESIRPRVVAEAASALRNAEEQDGEALSAVAILETEDDTASFYNSAPALDSGDRPKSSSPQYPADSAVPLLSIDGSANGAIAPLAGSGAIAPEVAIALEQYTRELSQLRRQMRWLAGALIGLLVLAGVVAAVNYRPQPEQAQPIEEAQPMGRKLQ